MSDRAIIHLTILWEHELREAARAIATMRDLPDTATEDEKQAAGTHVLGTCWTALRDLVEDPDGNVTVMACVGRKRPAPKEPR